MSLIIWKISPSKIYRPPKRNRNQDKKSWRKVGIRLFRMKIHHTHQNVVYFYPRSSIVMLDIQPVYNDTHPKSDLSGIPLRVPTTSVSRCACSTFSCDFQGLLDEKKITWLEFQFQPREKIRKTKLYLFPNPGDYFLGGRLKKKHVLGGNVFFCCSVSFFLSPIVSWVGHQQPTFDWIAFGSRFHSRFLSPNEVILVLVIGGRYSRTP